jgi:hypothetical protein
MLSSVRLLFCAPALSQFFLSFPAAAVLAVAAAWQISSLKDRLVLSFA